MNGLPSNPCQTHTYHTESNQNSNLSGDTPSTAEEQIEATINQVVINLFNSKENVPPQQNCPAHQANDNRNTSIRVDNRTYVGALLNGKPRGQGTLTLPNGKVEYRGEFKNGKAHGNGQCTTPNGDLFIGEMENGKPKEGSILSPSGQKYTGEMRAGKPGGQGRLETVDGRVYEGEFHNGLPHGEITLFFPEGPIFKGRYKHGRANGAYTCTLQDGSSSTGIYKDGYCIKSN